MYIYIIRNRANSKVYIGKSVKPVHLRWNRHLKDMSIGAKSVLYSAMRKHGTDAFYYEVLSSHSSHDELELAEKNTILSYNSRIPNGYNMTGGGDGAGGWNKGIPAPHLIGNQRAKGYKHSAEELAKISAASRGNTYAAGKPAWNRNSISVSCAICGKEMMVMRCRLKRTKCCSWRCRSVWMSEEMKKIRADKRLNTVQLITVQAN